MTLKPDTTIGSPVGDIVASIERGEPDRAKYHEERVLQIVKEKKPEEAAKLLGQELATLEEQSERDPLTRLKKHNAGQETLGQQLALARKLGHPLSVVVLDLDKFKEVNDTLGHETGNMVINAWGNFFVNEISGELVPVRFGGDEFYVIMPGSDRAEALRFAQRTQKEMHYRMKRAGFNVTSSIGIATLNENDKDGKGLFERADQNLLKAKEQRGSIVTDEVKE